MGMSSGNRMAAPFWQENFPLVLASGSATRATMLRAAGISIDIIKPVLDERAVEAPLAAVGAGAAEIATALAAAKARAISALYPGRWVLGADQTLICEGNLFHKPETPAHAVLQLRQLSGRPHMLVSAAALMRDGEIVASPVSSASLTMRALNEAEIEHYLAAAGDSVLSTVGGYQLEGLGIQLFAAIDGDHFTILGLPLLAVLAEMRHHGLVGGLADGALARELTRELTREIAG
jgi:septum formation protein